MTDAELAALTGDIGLRSPATPAEWHAQLCRGVQGAVQAAFFSLQATRREQATQGSPKTLDTEVAYYRLVGSDAALFRLMLEGRLGYYEAVLPRVVEVVARRPHGRIADLGAHGGLTTLYLARRFPNSYVVGIERCAEAVRQARAFQRELQIQNVEFVHGDYTVEVPGEGYDVVLSLQTMPTYLLPRVPSASPEHYLRGDNLARGADTSSPARHVMRALAAVRKLCRPGAQAILHERTRDFPFAALWLYLAAEAGLRLVAATPVTWRTSNERDGVQTAPLIVTEAQYGPAPFDEPAFLAFMLPRSDAVSLSGPEVRRGRVLTGPNAQFTFASLGDQRREVCVKVVLNNGEKFNIHLGITARLLAYVYTCTNLDFRELKVCDAAHRRALFQPAVSYIEQIRGAAEVASTSPESGSLQTLVQELVGD